MSKYNCPQALIGKARDAIRCKVSGSVCAHQKMCLMEGRIVLTDGALWCPGRGGRILPERKNDADVGVDAAGSSAAGVDHQDDVRRDGHDKG